MPTAPLAAPPGPVLLATYGTLMTGQANPLPPKLRARMVSLGPCLIAGTLYEIRNPTGQPPLVYPALLETAEPDAPSVRGEVFAIGATEADATPVLAATDAYEDFRPLDPAGSLYLRVRRTVRLLAADADRVAWVYVYNRPVGGARRLADGCWRAPSAEARA